MPHRVIATIKTRTSLQNGQIKPFRATIRVGAHAPATRWNTLVPANQLFCREQIQSLLSTCNRGTEPSSQCNKESSNGGQTDGTGQSQTDRRQGHIQQVTERTDERLTLDGTIRTGSHARSLVDRDVQSARKCFVTNHSLSTWAQSTTH